MRAVLCKELTGPSGLVVEEQPDLEAGAGQLRVEVAACGVNFPDILITQGLYQIAPPCPFSPGGEAAGVVSQVGVGVEGFAEGDRVMLVGFYGCYQSQLLVGPERLVKVPDSMPLDVAGSFLFTYGTGYHGLFGVGALREGESLLVLGAAGGVGLAAVEIGAALGGKVIAAASTEDKRALCRAHGAAETIDYTTEDLKKRTKALSGGGVDLVYDPVGGEHAEPALRACARGGRYLVIGFASGEIPKIPLNLPLLKECSIKGVLWGAWSMRNPDAQRANVEALLALFEAGKLKPHVSRSYAFEEAGQALEDMAARRVQGKVVLAP